jgi:hypothetical protein
MGFFTERRWEFQTILNESAENTAFLQNRTEFSTVMGITFPIIVFLV